MDKGIFVKVFVILALVFTVLATVGWIVFVGGFGNETVVFGLPQFNLVRYHYLWVITVISPILFIFMIIKSILMLLDIDALKKFYIIHALATIVIILMVLLLPFLGIALHQEVVEIRTGNAPRHAENAILAGSFLEIVFLGAAWICFAFSHLLGADIAHKE